MQSTIISQDISKRKLIKPTYFPTLSLNRTAAAMSSFHPSLPVQQQAALSTEEEQRYLKILSFGDSLTEGFHRFGFAFHPYSKELTKKLDEKLAGMEMIEKKAKALVHQRGLSGEFTDHMIPRLGRLLEQATAANQPYDAVCILGGTNDLSSDDSAEEVFHRLKQLYDQVLAHGDGKTVLVTITIPQSACKDDEYVSRREGINALIKEFSSKGDDSSSGQGRVVCVDAEKSLPFFTLEQEKDKIIWDDALHMTPEGYDLLGRLVFTGIEDRMEHILS